MKFRTIILALGGFGISILMATSALANIEQLRVHAPKPWSLPVVFGAVTNGEGARYENDERHAYVGLKAELSNMSFIKESSSSENFWLILPGSSAHVIYTLYVASSFKPGTREPATWDSSCTCEFMINNSNGTSMYPKGPLCGESQFNVTVNGFLVLNPANCPKSPSTVGRK